MKALRPRIRVTVFLLPFALLSGCGWSESYRAIVRSEQHFADGCRALYSYTALSASRGLRRTSPLLSQALARAEREFRTAIRQQPGAGHLYGRIGLAYVSAGRDREAIPWLEEAVEREPDNPLLLNDLGYLYADRGIQLPRAVLLLERAAARSPRDGNILDSLGWAYYRQGRLQEALPLLERAARRRRDPVILDHLTTVRQALDAQAGSGRPGVPSETFDHSR